MLHPFLKPHTIYLSHNYYALSEVNDLRNCFASSWKNLTSDGFVLLIADLKCLIATSWVSNLSC
jgi:hypothetical protein